MQRSVLAMLATLALATAACGKGPAPAAVGGTTGSVRTRVYYIAADEVVWDYAPTGTNQIEGRPFNDVEKTFMEPGKHAPGRKEMKALYREYTDSSFTRLKPRTPEWEHLGFLGPLIRGEVGDTINVVFRNNARFKASLHPHGVFYNKDSEGALYNDGTTGADKSDDGVPQGETHTYVWQVSERAGPAEHDGSSVLWMYHSHIDEIRDVASGLVGPMIVTRRGSARADGSPADVDRELVAGFMEVDENQSWYVEDNVKTYTTDPKGVKISVGGSGEIVAQPDADAWFKETINGFSYGHTPGLTMRVGERVRWYLMASTHFEFHSPHWHGNVVISNHMRTDVAALLPMGMAVADMVPDNPGTWLFHCHVSDHLRMGMQAMYTVAK
jgi:FtsP/CotA-like multicopper oxidase with cupredoxin domain